MKFALNYSPEAVALLEAGKIQVDLFKCPDWPHLIEAAAKVRPIYVHFPLVAGRGMEKVDWGRIDQLYAETGTRYINVHLAPIDEGDPQREIDQMFSDVQILVDRYGAEHVIVENVPYYGAIGDVWGSLFLFEAVKPETITRLADTFDCGFLFDISHARITADTLKCDVREYIRGLPLHRMRELHITGLKWTGEKLLDHTPMREEDWPVVEWVIAQIHAGVWPQPQIVALEYGGIELPHFWSSESSVIAADVPRLTALLNRVQV